MLRSIRGCGAPRAGILGIVLGLALTGALGACAQLTSASKPASTLKEGTLRTTLDNGLKVILVEDHSAPVVALNVWVRTGSADEMPSEAGMAHVFEHMLFK